MKWHFVSVLGGAAVVFSVFARADEADRLAKLSFTETNSKIIQRMVSEQGACAELLRTALVPHSAYGHLPGAVPVDKVRVIDGCKTISFSHNGSVEVVATVDLDNGDGPLNYAAVYKRSGLLDVALLPVGEGNGARGPIALFLADINHDGRLELVENSRVPIVDGRLIPDTDPAPTVTHVYAWRNNALVLSTAEYRSYISMAVLPGLRRQLEETEAQGGISPRFKKKAEALLGSIMLASRFLDTGHYFSKSLLD